MGLSLQKSQEPQSSMGDIKIAIVCCFGLLLFTKSVSPFEQGTQ